MQRAPHIGKATSPQSAAFMPRLAPRRRKGAALPSTAHAQVTPVKVRQQKNNADDPGSAFRQQLVQAMLRGTSPVGPWATVTPTPSVAEMALGEPPRVHVAPAVVDVAPSAQRSAVGRPRPSTAGALRPVSRNRAHKYGTPPRKGHPVGAASPVALPTPAVEAHGMQLEATLNARLHAVARLRGRKGKVAARAELFKAFDDTFKEVCDSDVAYGALLTRIRKEFKRILMKALSAAVANSTLPVPGLRETQDRVHRLEAENLDLRQQVASLEHRKSRVVSTAPPSTLSSFREDSQALASQARVLELEELVAAQQTRIEILEGDLAEAMANLELLSARRSVEGSSLGTLSIGLPSPRVLPGTPSNVPPLDFSGVEPSLSSSEEDSGDSTE